MAGTRIGLGSSRRVRSGPFLRAVVMDTQPFQFKPSVIGLNLISPVSTYRKKKFKSLGVHLKFYQICKTMYRTGADLFVSDA